MLEILKTFNAEGIAMGTYGESKFGSMTHISFMLMTTCGCGNGIELDCPDSDFQGSALVRITMPPQPESVALIKELKLGDKIKVQGFVCLETETHGERKGFVYYGTNIDALIDAYNLYRHNLIEIYIMKRKEINQPVVVEEAPKRIKNKKSKALNFLDQVQRDLINLAEREVSVEDLDITCQINPVLYSDMILCRHSIDNDITKYYY